jgi:hypothetical protein
MTNLTIKPDLERELMRKSQDGLYIGTVLGSEGERRLLAGSVRRILEEIDSRLARKGVFSQVSLEVVIRDGKLYTAETIIRDSQKAS